MTIKELIQYGINELRNTKYGNEIFIAKQLLCKALKKDNQYILINQNKNLDEKICSEFNKYLSEIIEGKPLQYITNNQSFMGYDFWVNENVLIPQPDTEIVVQECIKIYNNFTNKKNIKILDLCTGSGSIGISLDKILNEKEKKCEIFASDISDNALRVARKNQESLKSNVKFIKSDMFEDINEKFDIIISNPPYIKTDIINTLSKDVQREPMLALDGGNDGLKFYKTIENMARKYLYKNGYICMEIGYDQAKDVTRLFKEKYEIVDVIKDFSNNDRCVIVKNRI